MANQKKAALYNVTQTGLHHSQSPGVRIGCAGAMVARSPPIDSKEQLESD